MIIKVCQFQARRQDGERLVEVFQPGEMEKAASFFSMGKTAAPLLSPVKQLLETIRPNPQKIVLLVNALGASEYWSSNINGDAFPEASLIHKGPAYGYETFRTAGIYTHHKNKNINESIGTILLSTWHDLMKRVELVVEIDRSKAAQFGATSVCDKVDQGIYCDVSMGCSPPGTRIYNDLGQTIEIERVQIGDAVISHTGKVQHVSKLMTRKYKGTLYTFNVYGFRRTLSLTDEHPLWLVDEAQLKCNPSIEQDNKSRRQRHCTPFVQSKSKGCSGCMVVPTYQFEWRRADEVNVGDYLAFPVLEGCSNVISSIDEARFLGFYLAEGHVGNYNDRPLEQITFSLNFLEKDLANEIEQLGRKLGAKVSWQHEVPERGGRYVTIVNKDLADKCLQFCGSGAKTKVVSKEVLLLPAERQLAFLGAYLDGDGGVYKGSIYFSTASERLSEQLFTMLARCEIIASINKIEHRPSEKSVVRKDTVEYQVWVGTDYSVALQPYTHKTGIYVSSKVRGQRFFYDHEGATYLMAPILEIEESVYDGDVFNFSVEGDDSYVAEGLAVHNCKVPFDTCSICLDLSKYEEAKTTFDPSIHKSPGEAILIAHKKNPIRGVSITRNDYCAHLRKQLNKILPDGRKVCAINDYPRFFDISFVFIGADKTAKVMAKLASNSFSGETIPSWQVAEEDGYTEMPMEKAASVGTLLPRVKSAAEIKSGEIEKDVIPSQFGSKAIPAKDDIPNDILDTLGGRDLSEALSTPTMMGMFLRPREFQRITIISMGNKPLADELDNKGIVFPHTDEDESPADMGSGHFSDVIKKLLMPFLEGRSALEPVAKRRMVKITIMGSPKDEAPLLKTSSHPFMQKLSAAYNGYLRNAIGCLSDVPDLVEADPYLWSAVHNRSVGDIFFKTAEVSAPHVLGAAIAAEAISVMARRDIKRKEMQGEQAGLIEDLIATHPHVLASLAALGVLHAEGSSLPKDLLAKLTSIGKSVISR